MGNESTSPIPPLNRGPRAQTVKLISRNAPAVVDKRPRSLNVYLHSAVACM